MELESLSELFGIAAAVTSGSYAAIQAGISQKKQATERRMAEVLRLIARREALQATLDDVFDYETKFDDHLRTTNLTFPPDQADTRQRADQAFEHFREVHLSVKMGLITTQDLSPWIYWIHRIGTRPALARYSEACGYEAFINDLAQWTSDTPELQLLRQKCPSWEIDQQRQVSSPASPPEGLASRAD